MNAVFGTNRNSLIASRVSDRRSRETAVKVVDQHHDLIDFRLIEEFLELCPESMDCLGKAFGFRRLEETTYLIHLCR